MIKDIIIKSGTELKQQYYSIKASQTKEKLDLITQGIIATNGKIDLYPRGAVQWTGKNGSGK